MECEDRLKEAPGSGESGADGGGDADSASLASMRGRCGFTSKVGEGETNLEAPGDKVREMVWKNLRPLSGVAEDGRVGKAGRVFGGTASLIF